MPALAFCQFALFQVIFAGGLRKDAITRVGSLLSGCANFKASKDKQECL